jgi:hypothetical protein
MSNYLDRRHFVQKSLAAGGIAAGLTFEHQPLAAKLSGSSVSSVDIAGGPMPKGKIDDLEISRLICGGNLFSGFAHSGELVYVSGLLRDYFSNDKILDTLQLCEESGINTAILRTDDQIIEVIGRYRKERGGNIQWIAQTYPTVENLTGNIQRAIDNGAVGAFIMGGNADKLVEAGRIDLIAEVVSFLQGNGLIAGVGSHSLSTPSLVEKEKIDLDFYFKTINSVGYATQEPSDVATFMKTITKPWIGFKVLGAGRVKPRDGFDLAFKSGADFVNVGMYDFQVKEDIGLVSEIVGQHQQRDRAWA